MGLFTMNGVSIAVLPERINDLFHSYSIGSISFDTYPVNMNISRLVDNLEASSAEIDLQAYNRIESGMAVPGLLTPSR